MVLYEISCKDEKVESVMIYCVCVVAEKFEKGSISMKAPFNRLKETILPPTPKFYNSSYKEESMK